MKDFTLSPALVSASIAIAISALSFALNLWKIRREIRQAERRLSEQVTLDLIKQRVSVYHQLMLDLRRLSSHEVRGFELDELKSRVDAVIQCLQTHIFGTFGLISSHETRETVIRLRAVSVRFLNDEVDFEKLRKACWEVHQMLRSDLGLSQPNLLNAIDRLHRASLAGTESQIEGLLRKIHHNTWSAQPSVPPDAPASATLLPDRG